MITPDQYFSMSSLTDSISEACDWAIDRIHFLSEDQNDIVKSIEDSHAIHCEFHEWLNPNLKDFEVYSISTII